MKTKDLLDQRFRSGSSKNDLSTIDLKPILEECMGHTDLLEELISLYHGNALEFIGAAKIHLGNSNFKALRLAAHKIKPGLAMMRTYSLHTIIVLVLKECEGDKDIKHLQFLCECFAMDYPKVKKSIDLSLSDLDRTTIPPKNTH